MVDIKKRFFCVVGPDFFARQKAIAGIKKQILGERPEAFNTVYVYSRGVELDFLREQVFTFSFDKEKAVIFKGAQNLPAGIKSFLFENFQKIITSNFVIVEIENDFLWLCDKKTSGDKFFKQVCDTAFIIKTSPVSRPAGIEDFKSSLKRGDYHSAVYIMEKLYEGGAAAELGVQVLGVMGSVFSSLKNQGQKAKYLDYVFDADRAIKEKGLDSRLVIEMLFAKLIDRQP